MGITTATAPRSSFASVVWDNVRRIVYALILAFGVRFWVVQAIPIPSRAMEPTLLGVDYMVVTNWLYGESRFCFIALERPSSSGRLFGSEPQGGTLTAFRPPAQPQRDFVKRLIGLPGDTKLMEGGAVWIPPTGADAFFRVARVIRPDIPPSLTLRPDGPSL